MERRNRIGRFPAPYILYAVIGLLAVPEFSKATPLDPLDSTFGSGLALPTGNIVFDTDNLEFNGTPGGVAFTPAMGPDIAVFAFTGGSTLAAGATITAMGSRPLAILFQGSATILGTIDVSGADGTAGTGGGFLNAGIGGTGAVGGRAGGDGFDAGSNSQSPFFINGSNGSGPGGGGRGATAGNTSGGSGGGGGGFGTAGSATGTFAGGPYGDLQTALEGGSGGGGGGGVCCSAIFDGGGGGAGGGAVEIGAVSDLVIGGSIIADGGDGANGNRGGTYAGGGGSGGGILLHGYNVDLSSGSLLSVSGGGGAGMGGCGRIAVLTNTDGNLSRNGKDTCANTHEPVFATGDNIGMAAATTPDNTDPAVSVPEPAMLLIFGFGIAGLAVARRDTSL